MGRRRRRNDSDVSLFPFLSVLACVIGTLVLLLSAVAVGGIGGRSLDQVRLAQRLDAAEIFLAGGEALLQDFEAQIEALSEALEENERIGRRLAALGLDPEISLEEVRALIDLKAAESRLDARTGQLQREMSDLAAHAERRSEELERREAVRLRTPILIDPSGIGPDYRPYLVECTKEYLEIHQTQGDFSFRIPSTEVLRSPEYRKFLRRVRAISQGLVIFLIRPDGVATFGDAEQVAYQFRVRNAKLPLPGEGVLDFSLLKAD